MNLKQFTETGPPDLVAPYIRARKNKRAGHGAWIHGESTLTSNFRGERETTERRVTEKRRVTERGE